MLLLEHKCTATSQLVEHILFVLDLEDNSLKNQKSWLNF